MPAGAPLRHRHSRAGGNPAVPAQAGIQLLYPLLRRHLQKRGRDRSAVKLVSPRRGRLPRLLHRVSGRRLPEEAAAPPPAPSFPPISAFPSTPAGPVARAASPCIREASAERGRGPTPSSVIPPLAPSFPRRRESSPAGPVARSVSSSSGYTHRAGCQTRGGPVKTLRRRFGVLFGGPAAGASARLTPRPRTHPKIRRDAERSSASGMASGTVVEGPGGRARLAAAVAVSTHGKYSTGGWWVVDGERGRSPSPQPSPVEGEGVRGGRSKGGGRR